VQTRKEVGGWVVGRIVGGAGGGGGGGFVDD
jgi:hypothetical protein